MIGDAGERGVHSLGDDDAVGAGEDERGFARHVDTAGLG
jgi:hypothetical protein